MGYRTLNIGRMANEGKAGDPGFRPANTFNADMCG
jgi:hypothetical protein